MRFAFALAAVLLPAAAQAQVSHDASAASTAHVEIVKNEEGELAVVMKVRNARFVPYVTYAADNVFPTRLVTIVSEVLTRSDREAADPSSTVSVAVDDVTGKEKKRLAAFSDPGTDGEVIARRYFAASMPGCCDGPTVHRVRALETGRALFRSTGPEDVGSAAWAEVPNAHPEIRRWAAFDGDVGDEQFKNGVLGFLTYGSDEGPLARLQLSTAAGEDERNELWEGLAHGAKLAWIDPKHPSDGSSSPPGDAESPMPLWSLEGLTDARKLGGFRLTVLVGDKLVASIPVMGDRLVVEGATLSKEISLAPAQP